MKRFIQGGFYSALMLMPLGVVATPSTASADVGYMLSDCTANGNSCESRADGGAGISSSAADDDIGLGLSLTGSAGVGSSIALAQAEPSYIDSPNLRTQLRFRVDAAWDFDEPDRAEFFYSTWTNFGGKTSAQRTGPNDSINSQAFKLYYEQILLPSVSAFVEGAVILNQPSGVPGPGPAEQGFGDLVAGVKVLLLERCDRVLSFQLKNYIPTGDEDRWLTAGHYSIEPGVLYMQNLSRDLTFFGELRDWISIGGAEYNGANYAGNVLRYGAGLTYQLIDECNLRVAPTLEFVAWSVLEGQKFAFNPNGPVDAKGETIANIKLGARVSFGGPGEMGIGYGRALTGQKWYQDIVRVEWRYTF